MESAMRTGCLGLLVLLMAGTLPARAGNPKEENPKLQTRQAFLPSDLGLASSDDSPAMPRADEAGGAAQPPVANAPGSPEGTAAGSTGQAQQQQQQANDAQVKRDAELAALRREHYGPREGMWFGAGPLLWWIKQ